MKDIKDLKTHELIPGNIGNLYFRGGTIEAPGDWGRAAPVDIFYVDDNNKIYTFSPAFRAPFGTAGIIIGKGTGYRVKMNEADWFWYYEVELYNHIWGPNGDVIKKGYMLNDPGSNPSLYEFNEDGFPTHRFVTSSTGLSLDRIKLTGLVLKDHTSREASWPEAFVRNPAANWFPDVDKQYLEFSDPAKLDAIYADPDWDNENNWIVESASQLGYESNYYRDPLSFAPANWNGYTQTVDYTKNPITGLAWGAPMVPELPEVKIKNVWGVNQTSGYASVDVVKGGVSPITDIGVKYGTSSNVALATKLPANNFIQWYSSIRLQTLTPGTTYYVWPYAVNAAGEFVGSPVQVQTEALASNTIPTIITGLITNIGKSSANIYIDTVSDGGSPISEYGICYGTSQNPTIAGLKIPITANGGLWFDRDIFLTGINPGTEYHVRAYATNGIGTAYGANKTFTTQAGVSAPGVITEAATDVKDVTVQLNGVMTHNGGDTDPIALGFLLDTQLPVRPAEAVDISAGDTSLTNYAFSKVDAVILPNTEYWYAAYAENSAGRTIGNTVKFLSRTGAVATEPVLTTENTGNVTQTSARIAGRILSDGGAAITQKGVVWSTSQNPTVSLPTKTSNGTGNGYFLGQIVGLSPNTTYYVRSYATNSVGTAYGQQLTFKTAILDSVILTAPTATVAKDSSASLIAGIVSTGGNEIADKGFIVSDTLIAPTLETASQRIQAGSGTGTIAATVYKLTPGGTYYVRTYVFTSTGVYYGSTQTMTVPQYIATITQPGPDMWAITKGGFINRVLLIMNEAGMTDITGQSFLGANSANIDRYIEGSFENAWRMLATVVPKAWLTNATFTHYPNFANLPDGSGFVLLPTDFYLLSKFKMEGWQKAIFEASIEDERVSAIQSNRYTRGSTIRPAGVITEEYIDIAKIQRYNVSETAPEATSYSPMMSVYYYSPSGDFYLSYNPAIFKGVYNSTRVYDDNDLVIFNGELYWADNGTHKGKTPSGEPVYWRKLEKLKISVPGISAILKYYSLPAGLQSHTIEEAIYVPNVTPLTDLNPDSFIGINQRIIEPLAYVTAGAVFTIFEKDKLAASLTEKGLLMIPGYRSVKGNNVTFKQ